RRRARHGIAPRQRPAPDVPDARRRPVGRKEAGDGPVLAVDVLTKRFGGVNALADVDVVVRRGTVHALIGPNGSGKTTFLNVVSGLYDVTTGRMELDGESVDHLSAAARNRRGMARTFQNLQLWRRMSVLENVMVGAHTTANVGLLRSLLGTPASWRSERDLRRRAWGLLHFVGLAD